jgi:hypothetical protein
MAIIYFSCLSLLGLALVALLHVTAWRSTCRKMTLIEYVCLRAQARYVAPRNVAASTCWETLRRLPLSAPDLGSLDEQRSSGWPYDLAGGSTRPVIVLKSDEVEARPVLTANKVFDEPALLAILEFVAGTRVLQLRRRPGLADGTGRVALHPASR